jgi:hypothetical protein
MEEKSYGPQIVVLDRGFVYYSPDVQENGENLVLNDAKCIRRWGTTKGLGQLTDGPTKDTVLDSTGTVIAPKRALIHLIQCKRWN